MMKIYKNAYEEWYDMQFKKEDNFEEAYRQVYLKIQALYGIALCEKRSAAWYAYKNI